jgi:hypothetical protein
MAVAGLFLLCACGAKCAYLPTVGVPALRYQARSTNYFVFNPKLFTPAVVALETNSSRTVLAASSATNTTNVVASSAPVPAPVVNTNPTAAPVQSDAGTKNIPPPYFNSVFSGPAASDLLPVTSQMITDYLRPEKTETNHLDQPGVIVFVPAGMQFTPPEPKSTTGNRAAYHSQ